MFFGLSQKETKKEEFVSIQSIGPDGEVDI